MEIRITPVGRRNETLSGANFESLVWTEDQANPTGRVLEGSRDHGYAEEWAQDCETQYGEGTAYFLFDAEDIADRDVDEYPWDADHCDRIEVDVEYRLAVEPRPMSSDVGRGFAANFGPNEKGENMYAVICTRDGREQVRAGFETREAADIWSAKADRACPGWTYRTVPMIVMTRNRGEMEDGK